MLTRYQLRSHVESPFQDVPEKEYRRCKGLKRFKDWTMCLLYGRKRRPEDGGPAYICVMCLVFWVWDGCFLLPAGVHPQSLPTQHGEQSVFFSAIARRLDQSGVRILATYLATQHTLHTGGWPSDAANLHQYE